MSRIDSHAAMNPYARYDAKLEASDAPVVEDAPADEPRAARWADAAGVVLMDTTDPVSIPDARAEVHGRVGVAAQRASTQPAAEPHEPTARDLAKLAIYRG